MDNNLVVGLTSILEYRREHNSTGEMQFIMDYLMPLDPVEVMVGDERSAVAAYKLEIPNKDPNKKSKVLWSCHIDTMHHGKDSIIKQDVWVDDMDVAFVSDTDDCLGADDGAGVWLLLEMYKAGVEGTYMFHRGEEKGCIGSKAVRAGHRDFLRQHTHAIAFDRRALTSIITHQRSIRGCSEAFSKQFAEVLGNGYKSDDTGVYTDTAEYFELISECTNISTGYYSEHSNRETLDVGHVMRLHAVLTNAEKINAIDFVFERDCTKVERKPYIPPKTNWGNSYGNIGVYDGRYDDDYPPYSGWGKASDVKPKGKAKVKKTNVVPMEPPKSLSGMTRHSLNRGKTKAQRINNSFLDPFDYPSMPDLYNASDIDLAEWIDLAGPDTAADLMRDLLNQLDAWEKKAEAELDKEDEDEEKEETTPAPPFVLVPKQEQPS